jgi:hypothetical protein
MTPSDYAVWTINEPPKMRKDFTSMRKEIKAVRPIKWAMAAAVVLAMTGQAQVQAQTALYPRMAPIDQYLMERDAEIAWARSAAPASISQNAEILVMGRQGYTTAIKGKNGFVCLIERSWTKSSDDPEFWNPKVRAPICYNTPGSRLYVQLGIRKTEWALAGRTKAQIAEDVKAALAKKELPAVESGAMCYMMSKHGYLSDRDGHWHSHVMLFVPQKDVSAWGADLPGSPIFSDKDAVTQATVYFITVNKWSDGSNASSGEEHVSTAEQH